MDTAQNTARTAPDNAPMPTAPDALLARLDAAGIAYVLHHHPAFFTVAEGIEFEKSIPGLHCRNLFVRDKKGTMFLVSAANETRIDLKRLAGVLDCGRLSFGSADRLWTHLGVRPGSVCPYALVNDAGGHVAFVLDTTIMGADIVNFHPLENTMTIGVAPKDLVRFIESTGHRAIMLDPVSCAPEGE